MRPEKVVVKAPTIDDPARLGQQKVDRCWADAIDHAGRYVTGRVRDRRDVRKLCRAPVGDAIRARLDGVARGLEVSLRRFLQNGVVNGLIGNQTLQPTVLLLQSLQLLSHLWPIFDSSI